VRSQYFYPAGTRINFSNSTLDHKNLLSSSHKSLLSSQGGIVGACGRIRRAHLLSNSSSTECPDEEYWQLSSQRQWHADIKDKEVVMPLQGHVVASKTIGGPLGVQPDITKNLGQS
jgi:hypothetical protein